ncbi:hypothetical protein EW146_g8409 [Bondarzewia mesenterica]|uniref:FH2 domain-containing protein n=1 Tax=Bondarzewia mesenterica TaxID=1095465 RepID=A0A4S4LGF0_9AGAM|nr:hypothetical protein EW146_g8409 [Bondarzewia mesenterica]
MEVRRRQYRLRLLLSEWEDPKRHRQNVLRPFFWNKLQPASLASTVWSDVSSSSVPFFAMDDLESTFTMDNAASPLSPVSNTPARKQSVTTLLDITRANHVAIMLSRIKMGLPEIRDALLSVDDDKLSVDDLRAIGKQLPTSEEVTRLKDFDDVGKLAKADQYFYQAGYALIHLSIYLTASREVRSSTRFKGVLQAVLAVGNALNESSFRGNARGFKLEALLKMRETKTIKGGAECPTLLHYLTRVLLRTDPLLVNYIEDMPHLEAAARVSVQAMIASISALVNGLNQVDNEVSFARQSRFTLASDRFLYVMEPFVTQNATSIDAIKNMGAALDVELRSLLTYYGETPDSPEAPKPEDFFALILSFSSALQKAALEVHDAETKITAVPPSIVIEPQESEEPVSEVTIKRSEEQRAYAPVSQSRFQGSQSVGRGDLDQAIRSMREGKRRQRPNRPLNKIFLDGGDLSTD